MADTLHRDDVINELQKAVYERLTSEPILDLNGVQVPVFDFVPEGQALPYIVISEAFQTPWDDKLFPGYSLTLTINVFSGYSGNKEVNAIASQVLQALTKTKLDVTASGYCVVQQRPGNIQSIPEPDGLVRRRIIDFTLLIERTKEV